MVQAFPAPTLSTLRGCCDDAGITRERNGMRLLFDRPAMIIDSAAGQLEYGCLIRDVEAREDKVVAVG